MKMRLGFASFVVVIVCVLAIRSASTGLPIPGVPGLPNPGQAAKDIVSKQLVKQMGDEFNLEQPLRLSADAEYPIVASLPGGPFKPVSQTVIQSLYSHAHNGVVDFPSGDYAIDIFNYCMLAHEHVPTRNKFRLTPIQGRWADIVSALFARTSYGYSAHDVQILTWSLLAGMKYSELSPASRHLVDAVLPEFKSRMQESFYEKLQHYWGRISSNVPGVPSFDAALNQMGDVGKAIIELRSVRDELISNAADYDRIVKDFARIGVARIPSGPGATPWSIVKPGVYARMLNKAGYMTPGVLEIRVTREAIAQAGVRVAATSGPLPRRIAFAGVGLPTTGWAGFPGAAVQALGWNPKPGDSPGPAPGSAPSGSAPGGGGPKPGSTPGGGGPPNSGSNPSGSNPGGGSNNGGSGSNNSGNNQNASPSGHSSNDDDDDSNSPCDPPDNMFGVDNGTLVNDTGTMMTLGRGTGHGIVCLLLRPFIDLAPIGWPSRPPGQIDDGSIGFSVFGNPEPGHVVLTLHYTYAVTSSGTQLYEKKHITAYVDYGDVATLCPDIMQTIAINGYQSVSNWLSGAELENRDCITDMTGQSMHVTAWVMDGDGPAITGHARQVDPQNFLYADFWGHM